LGVSQLGKIDKFIQKRRAIVARYNKNFQELPNIKVPEEKKGVFCAWHLYPAKFNLKKIRKSKKQIYDFLKNEGLGVQVHYIPVHFHPYYQKSLKYKKGAFRNAEKFYEEEISLPLFPSMTNVQIDHVIKSIKKLLKSH